MGKSGNNCLLANASKIYTKFKKDHSDKFGKATGIEIQSQHLGENRILSMKGIDVEYFPTYVDISNNEENLNSVHI